jgi:hypothetical protein
VLKWAGAIGINYEAAQGLVLFEGNSPFNHAGFSTHASGHMQALSIKTGTEGIKKNTANGAALWTKMLAGKGSKTLEIINQDAHGNVYICGTSTNGFVMDLNVTPIVFTPPGAFICKLSKNGKVHWSRSIGDHSLMHSLDAAGNNYIAGYFSGTYNFDPGASNFSLTATGESGLYIVVLNAAGNFVKAKQCSR